MPYIESNLATKTEKPVSILFSLKESFTKENERQSELLNLLQDKMHNLVNRRSPEKDQMRDTQGMSQDFNSAMGIELDKLRNNTTKIEKILNHFEEIL